MVRSSSMMQAVVDDYPPRQEEMVDLFLSNQGSLVSGVMSHQQLHDKSGNSLGSSIAVAPDEEEEEAVSNQGCNVQAPFLSPAPPGGVRTHESELQSNSLSLHNQHQHLHSVKNDTNSLPLGQLGSVQEYPSSSDLQQQ